MAMATPERELGFIPGILGPNSSETIGLTLGGVPLGGIGGGGSDGYVDLRIVPVIEKPEIIEEKPLRENKKSRDEIVVPVEPPIDIIPHPLTWVTPIVNIPNTSIINPSVDLIWTQPTPDGTKRAEKIEDCFSVVGTDPYYTYEYFIGTTAEPISKTFIVRNKSVTNKLKVRLNVPQFLQSNAPTEFVLDGDSSKTVSLRINEESSLNLVMQNLKMYSEVLKISVEVMDVTGPVYVKLV